MGGHTERCLVRGQKGEGENQAGQAEAGAGHARQRVHLMYGIELGA
jgi:hypothetical protein